MISQHVFLAGQIIKIRYSTYTHYGVVSDRIGTDNQPMVIDLSQARGMVAERSWTEATGGQSTTLSDLTSCYSREETLRRAKEHIGTGQYSLLNYNCEVFARKVLGLELTSEQVKAAAITVPIATYATYKASKGNLLLTALAAYATLTATTYAAAR